MIPLSPDFQDRFNRVRGVTAVDGRVLPLQSEAAAMEAARWAQIYREAVNAADRRVRILREAGAPPDVAYLWRSYFWTLVQRHGAALEAAGELYRARRMPIDRVHTSYRGIPLAPLSGIADFQSQRWVARYGSPEDWMTWGKRIQEQAARELEQLPQVSPPSDTMGLAPAFVAVLYGVAIVTAGVVVYALGRATITGLFAYLGVDLESMALAREQIEQATQEAMSSCREISDPRERSECLRQTSADMVDALADANARLNRGKLAPMLALGAVAIGALYVATR